MEHYKQIDTFSFTVSETHNLNQQLNYFQINFGNFLKRFEQPIIVYITPLAFFLYAVFNYDF